MSQSDKVLLTLGADELKKSQPSLVEVLGAPDEAPTYAGKVILRSYAQKLSQGYRDEKAEAAYTGTALEGYMEAIRSDEDLMRYWSR
jgi:hypothetical protein